MDKIKRIATILVLVGFFLPWFKVNPGQELQRMMNQMVPSMHQSGGVSQGPYQASSFFQMPTVSVSGGDVPRGLGWLILILGVGAGILPLVARNMEHTQQRAFQMIALGSGSVLLVYLAVGQVANVSYGYLVVLAGFALNWVGYLGDRESGV